jgi:acyl-CoA thioesterase
MGEATSQHAAEGAEGAAQQPAEAAAQQVAEAACAAMLARDRVSRGLGLQVLAVGPGRATLRMTVRDDMLNGHDIAHGGVITTLADSAFAVACNSYNELTVAAGFDVNLVAAARLGDELTATATETSKAGRTGVYDIAVHNQHGALVAAFRGRSHTKKGQRLVDSLPITAATRAPGRGD